MHCVQILPLLCVSVTEAVQCPSLEAATQCAASTFQRASLARICVHAVTCTHSWQSRHSLCVLRTPHLLCGLCARALLGITCLSYLAAIPCQNMLSSLMLILGHRTHGLTLRAGPPAKRGGLAPGSFMRLMSEQRHISGERFTDVEAMSQACTHAYPGYRVRGWVGRAAQRQWEVLPRHGGPLCPMEPETLHDTVKYVHLFRMSVCFAFAFKGSKHSHEACPAHRLARTQSDTGTPTHSSLHPLTRGRLLR